MICSLLFFFFKQKTAYEMRISDWSSDVCSSDLVGGAGEIDRHRGSWRRDLPPGYKLRASARALLVRRAARWSMRVHHPPDRRPPCPATERWRTAAGHGRAARMARASKDRKSVVEGKSVSVRVVLGGGRIIKKKK